MDVHCARDSEGIVSRSDRGVGRAGVMRCDVVGEATRKSRRVLRRFEPSSNWSNGT